MFAESMILKCRLQDLEVKGWRCEKSLTQPSGRQFGGVTSRFDASCARTLRRIRRPAVLAHKQPRSLLSMSHRLAVDGEAVVQLRHKFLDQLPQLEGEWYEQDVERIRTNDWYVWRFYVHQQTNLGRAVAMMNDVLRWRKTMEVYELGEDTLPKEFFQANVVFPYGRDKNGNSILVMRMRLHQKKSEQTADLHRFLTYWVEKCDRTNPDYTHITMLMDCSGAGLSNTDLDFTKFLISLFSVHFPYVLECILVYDMPWLFNAIWNVVKHLLPSGSVSMIKFVNKDTILEYVDQDNLHVSMGGTNDTEPSSQAPSSGDTVL